MKTNTKKRGIFVALAAVLLVTAILVTTCVDSIDLSGLKAPQEKEQTPFTPPPGMGYIRLNIIDPLTSGRTVLPTVPTVNFYEVVATGTGTTSGTYNSSGTSSATYSPVVVPPGTYSVTVYAYSSGNNTTRVASGTTVSDVTVNASTGGTASVTLKEITSGGTGKFFYSFSLPTAGNVVDSAIMNVTNWPGNTAVAALTNVDVKTAPADTTTGVSLNSGFYYVTVALAKGGCASFTKLEIVHIYQNMDTTFTSSFDALSRNAYTVTYNNIDNASDTYTDVGPYTHGNTITNYFASTPPTAPPDTFAGWYKDSATTIPWAWATDVIIKDLDLYAKWASGENLTVTVTALPGSFTDIGFTLSPSTISFSHADLGEAAANASIVFSNADAIGASSIAWKRNNAAVGTVVTSPGPTPTPVTNDTLNLTFAADPVNVGLLVIGTYPLTVEATIDGKPYLATLTVTVTN